MKQNSQIKKHIPHMKNEKKFQKQNNESESGGGEGGSKIIWLDDDEGVDDDDWVRKHLQKRQSPSENNNLPLLKQVSPVHVNTNDDDEKSINNINQERSPTSPKLNTRNKKSSPQLNSRSPPQSLSASSPSTSSSSSPSTFVNLPKLNDINRISNENQNINQFKNDSVSNASSHEVKFPPLVQRPQQQQVQQSSRCDRHNLSNCVLCSIVTNQASSSSSSSLNPPSALINSGPHPINTSNTTTTPSENRCDRHGLRACVLCSGLISSVSSSQMPPPTSLHSMASNNPGTNVPTVSMTTNITSNVVQSQGLNCARHGLQDCFLCSLAAKSSSNQNNTNNNHDQHQHEKYGHSNVVNSIGSENSSEADEEEYAKYSISSVRKSNVQDQEQRKIKKVSSLSPYKTTPVNHNTPQFQQQQQQQSGISYAPTFDESVVGASAMDALRAAQSILSGDVPG